MRAKPTRQGWTVMVSAVLAAVVGRAFGIVELYVIAAAMGVAAVAAWLAVAVRRPSVQVHRWIRPSVLAAGDVGRVEVVVEQTGAFGSPSFELVEPVGTERTARMAVSPIARAREVSAGYRIPTERRGVLLIGPLQAIRQDVLGLARYATVVAGQEEVLVSPRAHLLAMPDLGQGVLGRHLLALAQRLGPGDFHSLRNYVDGDEPRSIHWRASARSEDLKVRQCSVEGLRRCLVVLDVHGSPVTATARGRAGTGDHDDAFERSVTAAASIVHSADRAGLTTRFVTTEGADLRGPDVAAQTLHLLARVVQSRAPTVPVERDPGEGLGLVVVVTADVASAPWRSLERIHDPALTSVGVFSSALPARPPLLAVDARSEQSFLDGWADLAGAGRRSPRRLDPVGRAS
ncbi:MAG: DUF58 domain-containing protein [Actinomycetota bacterium]|nr:DUF58 domain-containing protein [Actinomycetota bacterium]